jgi:hypothetical protein
LAIAADKDQVARFIDHELDLADARSCALAAHTDWTPVIADEAVGRYRDFLWVCWNCDQQGQRLAEVDLLADAIWHCHMLSPARYAADCARIFGAGRILDHYPIGSAQGVIDAVEQARSAYAAAGRTFPTDHQRAECVWGVAEPPR